MKIMNLTGKKFGRLTVIERAGTEKHKVTWLCRCDCGKDSIAQGYLLTHGDTKSCGCLITEMAAKTHTTHGGSNSRLYRTFRGMITRTSNQNRKDYPRYGGRGITVCDEWKNDFVAFRDWAMANGYRDDLSIDRINNDGNYEPSNCRWVDSKVQNNNRKNNHFLTISGISKTIAAWSRKTGICSKKIDRRLRLGWTPERALGMVA